jgi:hypothetical protein
MPIPQFQVVLARTAAVISPETQVLICGQGLVKLETSGGRTHDERQGRDEGEKQSRSSRGQIGDDDFGEQHDHGVSNLVDDGTSTESRDAVGGRFNDGTDDVEEDADDDEFESTENITDFGGRGLKRDVNIRLVEEDKRSSLPGQLQR